MKVARTSGVGLCASRGAPAPFVVLVMLFWLLSTLGCSFESSRGRASQIESFRASIVGGQPAAPSELAVALLNYASGLCSGTLIHPRLVLTAKHCLSEFGGDLLAVPSEVTLRFSDRSGLLSDGIEIENIVATPGFYGTPAELELGEDIALVILRFAATDMDGEPIPSLRVATSNEDTLLHQPVRALGYGLDLREDAGVLRANRSVVTAGNERLLITPAVACAGDSGGPLLDEDGHVVGVNSFSTGRCGEGHNGFTRPSAHLHWMAQVMRDLGACDADDASEGGWTEFCALLQEDAVCDPIDPRHGCPAGARCVAQADCTGRCMDIPEVPMEEGARCERDESCEGGACVADESGVKRCARGCRPGEGHCAGSERCVDRNVVDAGDEAPASAARCGVCLGGQAMEEAVARAQIASSFGEPCASNRACEEGLCLVEEGRSYCSTACATDADCPSALARCDGAVCLLGARSADGAPCRVSEDCRSGYACARGISDERTELVSGRDDGRGLCSRACDMPQESDDGGGLSDDGGGTRDDQDSCAPGYVCRALLEDVVPGFRGQRVFDGDAEVGSEGTAEGTARGVAGYCMPALLPLGALCRGDGQCLSRHCSAPNGDTRALGYCTLPCGGRWSCPAAYACLPDGEGQLWCNDAGRAAVSGGCAVAPAGGSGGFSPFVGSLEGHGGPSEQAPWSTISSGSLRDTGPVRSVALHFITLWLWPLLALLWLNRASVEKAP